MNKLKGPKEAGSFIAKIESLSKIQRILIFVSIFVLIIVIFVFVLYTQQHRNNERSFICFLKKKYAY